MSLPDKPRRCGIKRRERIGSPLQAGTAQEWVRLCPLYGSDFLRRGGKKSGPLSTRVGSRGWTCCKDTPSTPHTHTPYEAGVAFDKSSCLNRTLCMLSAHRPYRSTSRTRSLRRRHSATKKTMATESGAPRAAMRWQERFDVRITGVNAPVRGYIPFRC